MSNDHVYFGPPREAPKQATKKKTKNVADEEQKAVSAKGKDGRASRKRAGKDKPKD